MLDPIRRIVRAGLSHQIQRFKAAVETGDEVETGAAAPRVGFGVEMAADEFNDSLNGCVMSTWS